MINGLDNIVLFAFKAFFVLGSILYFIFALVIVRQTTMQTKNVKDKFNPVLVVVSFVHAAFATFLILLTLTL